MEITSDNSTFHFEDVQLMVISGGILTFMQVVNFFIGIPLNIYIIVILRRAGGLDESVFFAVSQSASEIIYALSAPLFILCELGVCLTSQLKFFNGIGMIARLMFQCLVCVERYLAVVHPVTFLKFKPLKYRLFCLIVAWTYILTCSIALIFDSQFFNLEFYGSFFSVIVVVEFFCCVSILKVLKQPAPGRREDSGMNNIKTKAFRIVLINLLTHLIQLVPLVILFTLTTFFTMEITIGAASITIAVNIAGGLMPPFYFLYRNGKLKITGLFTKTKKNYN